MKKIMIITGILLLALNASAQQNSRERSRQKVQDQRSEAAAVSKAQAQKANASAERRGHTNKTTSTAQRRATTHKSTATADRRTHTYKGNSSAPGTSRTTGKGDSRTSGKDYTRTTGKGNTRDGGKGYTGTSGKGNTRTTGKGSNTRHADQRRNYATPNRKRVQHTHGGSAYHTPVKYKKTHHYRAPRRTNVIWNPQMYREYRYIYPEFSYWYYPSGYRIVTVPSWNAYFHVGEVRNVYGRIHEVWYHWPSDEYYLYFGGTYPYQDFTVILSGSHARRFHRNPEAFFSGRYIWVTGLVSTFEGKPEIMVKRKHQVHLY